MKTKGLTEQFRELESIANAINAKRLQEAEAKNGNPQALFQNLYSPREEQKTEDTYRTLKISDRQIFEAGNRRLPVRPTINARASKNDLERMRIFVDALKSTPWEIGYFCERQSIRTRSFQIIRQTELDDKIFSTDPKKFEEYNKQQKEEYEKLYAPRPGHTACARCGKQVPNDKIVWNNIFSYEWTGRSRSLIQTKMPFCSARCAGDEQAAREG